MEDLEGVKRKSEQEDKTSCHELDEEPPNWPVVAQGGWIRTGVWTVSEPTLG
jgi:hypothetical protein